MNTKNRELQEFVLKMGAESGSTDIFFDELLLREVQERSNEYMLALIKLNRPLNLYPLIDSKFSNEVYITPSSRAEGEWQVTIFKGSEPLGHQEYKTFDEAIKENSLEWFTQGLWSESIS